MRLSLALTLVLLAPGTALGQIRGLEQAARRLADSSSRGSFSRHLAEAFAAEGVYLAAGPLTMRGPSGVASILARDSLNAVSRATWSISGLGVSSDQRDGYLFGFVDVIRPSGDTLPGRFHSYWRRRIDGRWEILAFSRAPLGASRVLSGERVPSQHGDAPEGIKRPDTTALLRAVYATEAAFADSVAVDAGRAFAFFAAPGAAKSLRGAYAVGPAAIAELFAGAGNRGPAWTPEWGSVATSGDLAFTLGPAWPRLEGSAPATPLAVRGRYFTIWARQADGRWRWVVD